MAVNLKQVSILVNASDSMFLFIDFVRVTNCFFNDLSA